MGRPLSGHLERRAAGWFASLPAAPGSRARTGHTFRTQTAAQAWLAASIEARLAGRPLPGPAPEDLVPEP